MRPNTYNHIEQGDKSMRGGETEVFDGKTLSNILEDVYNISKEKRKDIKELIVELSKMVSSTSDAVNVGPLIKDLLDVSVKNDDQLTKIATIVQRIITADAYKGNAGDPSELLSELEKEQLLRNVVEETKQVTQELEDIKHKVTP